VGKRRNENILSFSGYDFPTHVMAPGTVPLFKRPSVDTEFDMPPLEHDCTFTSMPLHEKKNPSAKTTCKMNLQIFPYHIKLEAGGEATTGIKGGRGLIINLEIE
jgi:hypothetical protein